MQEKFLRNFLKNFSFEGAHKWCRRGSNKIRLEILQKFCRSRGIIFILYIDYLDISNSVK